MKKGRLLEGELSRNKLSSNKKRRASGDMPDARFSVSKKCMKALFRVLHSLTGRATSDPPGRSFAYGSDFASKIARKSPHMSPIFDLESADGE